MSGPCREFRARLEHSLDAAAAQSTGPRLEHLAWHEHLLSCADCRALLASEEALEELLATLPSPRLPRRLAQRVLERLREARDPQRAARDPQRAARDIDHDLDELLALDIAERAPDALGRRVLAGLAHERDAQRSAARANGDAALDRLLERARDVEIPAGLAQRIQRRLAAERTRTSHSVVSLAHSKAAPRPQLVRRRALAAAAAIVVALGAWWWIARSSPAGSGAPSDLVAQPPRVAPQVQPRAQGGSLEPRTVLQGSNDAVAAALPGDDVLAVIDVLEQWDVLMHDDVDVLLSTSLSPADQLLLEDESSDALSPSDDDAGSPNGSTPQKTTPRANGDARKG